MAPEINLTRGNTSFPLNTLPYQVGIEFAPPVLNMVYNISSGTSANIYDGGSLIGQSAKNRQWSFDVYILGGNINDAHSDVRKLTAFIKKPSADTLYIDYRENNAIPVPLWGQFGAPTRFEVVTIDVSGISSDYTQMMGYGFAVTITVEIKPLARGLAQKLINATGGLFEDNYGTADGMARGLAVLEGTTNKMTNPVFGSVVYDTGWSASPNIVATKNSLSQFCLPGLLTSVKVISLASVNNLYAQTITAGNTNKHSFTAYVMAPDGGTINASVCNIYYNAGIGSTYQDLGNGLWLVYADNVNGIAAATTTGLQILGGYSVYLLGFQMEEKAYHTPLAFGDMLGHIWSGTAHASTSVRAAANLNVARTDDYISLAQGTINVIWKPNYSNTFGTSEILFGLYKSDYTVNSLRGYFEQSTDVFVLNDGTNTASSAAQTFNGGDVIHLTFTWGPAGLVIYKNGVSIATAGTYTPPSATNSYYFVIGQFNSGGQCNGDLLGFDVYPTQATQAQVTAIYTAARAIVSGAGRVSTVPLWWVKAGDGVVSNVHDATRNNWGVIIGCPGSMESETEFTILPSSRLRLGYWVMRSNYPTSYRPDTMVVDMSGTADVGNAVGDAVYQFNTPGTWADATMVDNGGAGVLRPDLINGKVKYFLRAQHTTGVGAFYFQPWLGTATSRIFGLRKPFSMSTNYCVYFCGDMDTSLPVPSSPNQKLNLGLGMDCTGASGNLKSDYGLWINGPASLVQVDGNWPSWTYLVLNGNKPYLLDGSANYYYSAAWVGEVVNALPGSYNIIWYIAGNDRGQHFIGDTATFAIKITPRFSLV